MDSLGQRAYALFGVLNLPLYIKNYYVFIKHIETSKEENKKGHDLIYQIKHWYKK
jgi:hypothetical protein